MKEILLYPLRLLLFFAYAIAIIGVMVCITLPMLMSQTEREILFALFRREE